MAGIDFKAICAALSCREFASATMATRAGRAQCPFHGGRGYNLAMYDDHVYCHSCHQRGDVIDLAAAVWGVDKLEAARKLNDDFNLGIAEGMTDTDRERAQAAHDRREVDRNRIMTALAEAREELEAASASGDADAIRRAEQWLSLKKCEAARGCIA